MCVISRLMAISPNELQLCASVWLTEGGGGCGAFRWTTLRPVGKKRNLRSEKTQMAQPVRLWRSPFTSPSAKRLILLSFVLSRVKLQRECSHPEL